jgi:hypothetical protein
MSARLNMNPLGYIPWKGQTLSQITSILQKNKPSDISISGDNRILFRPMPLKIVRRELLMEPSNTHKYNPRTSITLDEFDGPGRAIVSPVDQCENGMRNTLDVPLSTSKYDNGTCTDKNVCMAENAKRRVRSGGMYRQKYDLSKDNSKVYFADTHEYYMNRNKTFKQNSVISLRQGEPSVIAGFAAKTNFYVTTGLNKCNKAYIPNDTNLNYFTYYWLNDTYALSGSERVPDNGHQVTFPEGYYTIESLNAQLENVMKQKSHYLIEKRTGGKVFFMKFVYNNYNDKIELQLYPYSEGPSGLYDPLYYSFPKVNGEQAWTPRNRAVAQTASIKFENEGVSKLLGFSAGFYPDITPWLSDPTNNTFETMPIFTSIPQAFLSNIPHSVFPMYTVVNYKPSNANYGTDGGVSSSTRTLQEKYTTITRNGTIFAVSYGMEVSNAVAYGVPENINTTKDKIGYPLRSTPVFPKNGSGQMVVSCSRRKNMYNG